MLNRVSRLMKPLKWHQLYNMLAFLNLTVVCLSVYFNVRIMDIYSRSIAVNQIWSDQSEEYGALSSLAAAVNAPGNDIFDSRNVAGEYARMEAALTTFNRHHAKLEDATRREEALRPLAQGLSQVKTAMNGMLDESRLVFSYFSKNDSLLASRRMAAMDQKYDQLNKAVEAVQQSIRRIRRRHLKEQQAAAADVAVAEKLIIALTLIMVLGALFYGHRLAAEMEAAERERECNLKIVQRSEKMSAIGQLAAGVAHEINNPLGVILGFAQALSRQLVADDALELPIRSIEREALRCKSLVQDLLTFARTSHSNRGAMSLNDAVTLSLPLISPQAKLGGVRVTTALAEGLPPILGNKSQLEQVIMNLAKNAIDAMPNGGNLSLETELLEGAPHSWVCLKIADDGTGIPAAVLSKIFDPFFTTKPLGQGTGLGLSLVREIVSKHSGELTVDSRPGRTVFTVKLPARTGREIDTRVLEIQRERSAEDSATKGAISHA